MPQGTSSRCTQLPMWRCAARVLGVRRGVPQRRRPRRARSEVPSGRGGHRERARRSLGYHHPARRRCRLPDAVAGLLRYPRDRQQRGRRPYYYEVHAPVSLHPVCARQHAAHPRRGTRIMLTLCMMDRDRLIHNIYIYIYIRTYI